MQQWTNHNSVKPNVNVNNWHLKTAFANVLWGRKCIQCICLTLKKNAQSRRSFCSSTQKLHEAHLLPLITFEEAADETIDGVIKARACFLTCRITSCYKRGRRSLGSWLVPRGFCFAFLLCSRWQKFGESLFHQDLIYLLCRPPLKAPAELSKFGGIKQLCGRALAVSSVIYWNLSVHSSLTVNTQ